jgi:tRNA-2-methylthio-N6-dimethylallyladenosine synthase
MRYAVVTFGCQMNQHDSERLEEVLRVAGHVPALAPAAGLDGSEQAYARAYRETDLVVLNTCSVRDKAEQKLRSEVGRFARLKRQRPDLMLVVAGCVAQQESERLLARMPAIDLVIGPDNIPELPALVADHLLGAPPRAHTVFDLDAPRFLTAPTLSSGRVTAFVTTMKGCNERCSFCIVPTTRGPERYRPSDDIVAEVGDLVRRGIREVTLLGQTVNSYRDPAGRLGAAPDADVADPDESEFAALLWAIAARVPELARLRYTSPHPRHLTPSLIRAHAELALLPRHVHLPVQSGSDRVLKRMIRRYTRAGYLERVARLRAQVPDVTLSTDVIVGFPGEDERDFEQTLSLLDEVGHVGVFGFKYSPRPSTPALKLGDDVPESVKAERLARLFQLSEATTERHLAGLVGTTQEVLVEGPSKAPSENLCGRTQHNEIVHVARSSAAPALAGALVAVEIVRAFKHSLLGEVIGEERHATPKARPRALPLVGTGRGGGAPWPS